MDRFMKYYVYVIRLSDAVLKSRKFRRRNPDMIPGFPCFYVGQSCHFPRLVSGNIKKGKRVTASSRNLVWVFALSYMSVSIR